MASPVVQLRVPDDMLAAIDAERGEGQSRSAWFLAMASQALERRKSPERVEIIPLEPKTVLRRSQRARDESCQHPQARRAKGLCNACGQGGL